MVTDSGQIVVREQWDHPYKEGSSFSDFGAILCTVLCKLVVSLQMQNRKTTDKISTFPNFPNYSIVVIADQRALRLHFATDNQLAKPCSTVALEVTSCSSPLAPVSCRVFSTAPVRSSRIQYCSSVSSRIQHCSITVGPPTKMKLMPIIDETPPTKLKSN